jgi:hypothetical protein
MRTNAPVDSYLERKRIREERQRLESEGFRVDIADLCICPNCGGVHYKQRGTNESSEKVTS